MNALEIALQAAALVFSLSALAGTVLVWSLSSSSRIRAFESRIEEQVARGEQRLTAMEYAMTQHNQGMAAVTEEITGLLERTATERRRVQQERVRLDKKDEPNGQDVPLEALPRDEQLRRIRASFGQ